MVKILADNTVINDNYSNVSTNQTLGLLFTAIWEQQQAN